MKPTNILWAIVFSVIVAACGGDTVTVDAPTFVDSVTVTADPPTLAPALGRAAYTQQYHAMVNYSDGTSKDASGVVTWTTSNGSAMTIDQNGLGKFDLVNINVNNLYGDVTVWAEFATVFDSVVLTISRPAPGAPVDTLVWDIKKNR